MTSPDAIRSKLAAARASKIAREEAAVAEAEAAEVERFELAERFETETGGREGRAFAIVDFSDLGEGFVVLRLGEGVLWKTFSASKMTVVDTDAYRSLAARRGFVADRCAHALATLFGVERADARKK
jgi:hypothetical protein